MEEREGTVVSYDSATRTAVVTDSYTNTNVTVIDVGSIGATPIPLPDRAAIIYIAQYLPPRGPDGAAKIVNTLKEVRA